MSDERDDVNAHNEHVDDETFDTDSIDTDAARLEARNAEARESMVARAHRKHGLAGAIVAGGMLAIDQVLGRRPKEQPAAVSEFSGEPTDIDKDGIQIPLDDNTTVISPAPHLRPGNKRIVRRRRRASGQSAD
ncbi:MAG: hypothetical protein ACKO8T_06225 [Actinomycetota bacterium]